MYKIKNEKKHKNCIKIYKFVFILNIYFKI